MSEAKAHLLIGASMLAIMVVVCLVLGSMHADGTAYGMATVLVGGAAAFASSLVVMHFDSPRTSRRR